MNRSHCTVRKGLGVEPGGVQSSAVEPEADGVLAKHLRTPLASRTIKHCWCSLQRTSFVRRCPQTRLPFDEGTTTIVYMLLHALLSGRPDSEGDHEEMLQILASVLNAFPVACFMIDKTHRVIHWNRACEILTGTSADSVLGTREQGKVFYGSDRMVMADLVLVGAKTNQVDALYHGKFRPSPTVPGTYEAEDFFPQFGESGRWLYFTASRIVNSNGELIGAIETLQDVTARREAEAALRLSEERFKMLSHIDDLTQLFNSRRFHEALSEEIDRAKRYGHPLSLLVFDLDFFKRINDMYGHQAGDDVLRRIAQAVAKWKRTTDLAFRFGGDEFAVILPETHAFAAKLAADRLIEVWHQLAQDGADLTRGCTLSIGVAQVGPDDSTETFVRRADNAAYEAKRQGRNRVVLDDFSSTP